MLLSQYYETLYYTELNNLLLDNLTPGVLPEPLQSKALHNLNQALIEIYTRLPLLNKEVVLEARDEISIYYLQKKYALQDPTVMPVGMKYLLDTPDDPFVEDVIKISEVYDEIGNKFALNDPLNPNSLYTPKYDALQLTQPVTGATHFVVYQAKHPKITGLDLDAEIMLPPYLESAARSFACSLLFGSMNGAEHKANALDHSSKFQEAMAQAETLDLARTSLATTTTKFDERGFV